MPFQILDAVVLMAVKTDETVLDTALTAPVTTDLIPSQMPVKKETIPFQVFSKKVLIAVQTSLQFVPNQPKTVLVTPTSVSHAAVKMPEIAVQIPEKTSLMPFHS